MLFNMNRIVETKNKCAELPFFKGDYVLEPVNQRLGEDSAVSIEMNCYSLSLAFKSIFVTDKRALYLCTLINLFQKLPEHHQSGKDIKYKSYSHALTTYFLRMLAKHGFIEIISSEKFRDYPLLGYSYEITGSEFKKETSMNMYDVVFVKRRNFQSEDAVLLEKIMNALKIPTGYIKLTYSKGQLRAHISNREKLKSIRTTNVPKEVAKRMSYFKKC